jgi:hypothetical protein
MCIDRLIHAKGRSDGSKSHQDRRQWPNLPNSHSICWLRGYKRVVFDHFPVFSKLARVINIPVITALPCIVNFTYTTTFYLCELFAKMETNDFVSFKRKRKFSFCLGGSLMGWYVIIRWFLLCNIVELLHIAP